MRLLVFIPALLFILSLVTLSAVPVYGAEVEEVNRSWYNRFFGNRGQSNQNRGYPSANLIQNYASASTVNRNQIRRPAMPQYGNRGTTAASPSKFAMQRKPVSPQPRLSMSATAGRSSDNKRVGNIVKNSFESEDSEEEEEEEGSHSLVDTAAHTASRAQATTKVVTQASGTTNSGQTIVIQKDKESGMDMFMKFLPLIILILVIAIICVLIYIFRDKLPVCISACETCCEWTWIIIVWPFKMLWRGFKCVVYPLKEACFECCGSCHDCCYPSQIKI